MHLPKKCSAFRVVLGALLLVALLQLLYLSFLSKFHGKQQRSRYSELFPGSGPGGGGAAHSSEKNSRKERLRYSLSSGGIFDHSGQYRVYKNLIQSDWTGPNVLTLATHTSLSNLHHLSDLAERWRNPISVAVFAHGQDVRLATALLYALGVLCPRVQALVDFHLVCLSGETASFPQQDHLHFAGLDDCAAVFSRLEAHRSRYENYALGVNVSYPNNLLRNVARGGTEASYVLVIDIDTVPSADLHQQFSAMVAGRQPAPDRVFVLPAFEIRHTRKMPATKAELVRLYQVGEVRPFYEELCPRCQAPSNYSRWVNGHVSEPPGALEVAYTLTWVDPWEPFYIGPRDVPLYDENFKQYGFNRISQACELHVAGYEFSVLSSAFLVHRGFKVQGEFHAKKDEENKRNRLLFRSFKEALKSKYPTSSRRC
ncbi:beta-1,4-glucuronyltransferase 1 [Corythoichthys intestinalis]|uniref:beta-1,4-glucuronyltransferase 1 n=1 Tax=Corythoichthys intestinalis TaxID=161448 RepID=UPI0025A51FB5|nr:beta-1,4-glucuronyltransferase 1 [Corythoichthys intestinalis]XP_061810547.1 beta-1,4-glucuronyltransferase 1-like [Nerophis lumbriciformis]